MVLSNSPGNQAVHLQLTWPMLVADLFPGWLQVQDRFGSPAARTGPTQGVGGKVDIHTVMPARSCLVRKQQVEAAVQSAQQCCYLPCMQIFL